MAQGKPQARNEPPVLLVKWYDVTKWLLDRVDSFAKNQRFVFGQAKKKVRPWRVALKVKGTAGPFICGTGSQGLPFFLRAIASTIFTGCHLQPKQCASLIKSASND